MLDHYTLRCLTYGDGATSVQARHGHPALRALRDAGYPAQTSRTHAGTGRGHRPQIVLIPITDWATMAPGNAARRPGLQGSCLRLTTCGKIASACCTRMHHDPH